MRTLTYADQEDEWRRSDKHRRVKQLGLDDAALLELMSVVDLFSGLGKLMDGPQVEPDEKPWYG